MNRKNLLTAAFFDLLWVVIIGFLLMKNSGETKLIIRLLSPRYWWLLWMSFGAFILFFLNKITALAGYCRFSMDKLSLRKMFFLFIPAILLPFSLDESLGADILDKRALSNTVDSAEADAGSTAESVVDQTETAEQIYKTDSNGDLEMIELLDHSDDLLGSTVSIVGMVGNYPELPPDTICLFRFFSSCCAADAFPAGLLVRMPEEAENYPENEWIRVKGEVTLIDSEGKEFAGLNAQALESAEEPPDPIVYINY